MTNAFFEAPVLNSPYDYPGRHWALDETRQSTNRVLAQSRPASYITPVPRPRKQKGKPQQQEIVLDEGQGLSTEEQQYYPTSTSTCRGVRSTCPPRRPRLLKHWRECKFSDIRPFFCQGEAVETVIWLTKVAPQIERRAVRKIRERVDAANEQSDPDLARLALKLATGARKATVMAMLIAWQTITPSGVHVAGTSREVSSSSPPASPAT